MVHDIYTLSPEVELIATKPKYVGEDICEITSQLEKSLNNVLSDSVESSDLSYFSIAANISQ